MAIDRWFFGGGAEHTPESARRALYASTGGAEGVGGINDLKVAPLATPGQGVRVLVGSALIKSRYVGGETQTYMGTVYTQETVSTTPTGSGQTRADLVVMRVEDPYAAGSTYPEPPLAERATAPYVHIRVISGVPANAKKLQDVPGYQNDTAITLARINFPASTGTVTSGMITDLRKVAMPRRETYLMPWNVTGAGTSTLTSTAAYPGGQTWPVETESAWGEIWFPEWATRAKFTMTWGGVLLNGNVWGDVWVQFAPTAHPNHVVGPQGRFDTVAGNTGPHRETIMVGHDIAIPAGLRGGSHKIYPRATKNSGSTGSAVLDWASSVVLQVEFYEQAS